MKRLALALFTSLMASGCIYLTPPTGLRLGSHLNEFPAQSDGGEETVAMSQYKAPDFMVLYPSIWQVLPLIDLVSQRDGKMIKRVSIGQMAKNGDAEGLQVTNLLIAPGNDNGKTIAIVEETVLNALKSGLKDDIRVVASEARTFGGESGRRLEVTGTGIDETDPTTGEVFVGKPQHFLASICWHNGRAYVLVLSTIESRWSEMSQLFDAIAGAFRFLDGAPVGVCTAAPSIDPAGTKPVVVDGNASAPMKYVPCTPDAGSTAAVGGAATTPAPLPSSSKAP